MVDVHKLSLNGLLLLQPRVYPDSRGFYAVNFEHDEYRQAGINVTFVQDSLTQSTQGTLRGLHYQIQSAQSKLIQVLDGEVFDVAVDLRRSSPTFGQWESLLLSAETLQQFWLPAGFAHGFYVLSERALVAYKVTDVYDPEGERTILWNDLDLAIAWPLLDGEPLLSEKDQQGVAFRSAEVFE